MRSVFKTIFVASAVAVLAAGVPGALWAGNLVQNGQFTSNTGYGWVGQNFGHGTTSISVSCLFGMDARGLCFQPGRKFIFVDGVSLIDNTTTPSTVPEPSTVLSSLLGVAGLAVHSLERRSSAIAIEYCVA